MPRQPPPPFSPASHEPVLPRSERRSQGVYYTPPEIARLIAERTLRPLLTGVYARVDRQSAWVNRCDHAATSLERQPLRVLDPACGAGEFLLAARAVLGSQSHELFGVDIDPSAVAVARRRLSLGRATEQVRVADALDDNAFPRNAFDAILGNPPYVSIRELARRHAPATVQRLRERFRTARGNFDLYVLFIERAFQWLRPGGRCGLIVPNKWATLDYARPCRELLLEQATIDEVIDLSEHRVFRQASVYPQVLIFTKQVAPQDSAIDLNGGRRILQRSLTAESFALSASLDVESQVATRPLGQIASLQCGTPGYAAAKVGSLLREGVAVESPALSFITSGNIDRYAISLGNVRYLNRVWREPTLPREAPELTRRQRTLFGSPKIVVAGMSRRIEAAWDACGLALGVQVFAATEFRVDPFYLLALLNSKLLSYLFRTRFAAKRLAGGYLAINKGQLARLPIVVDPSSQPNRQQIQRLADLARNLANRQAVPTVYDEAEIDRLVGDVYHLTPQQAADVEQHFDNFAANSRRAA